MIKSKSLFCLLPVMFCWTCLFAQPGKTFSGGGETFLKEMEAFIETVDKKVAKELLDQFEPIWIEQYSAPQQEQVLAIANTMAKRRMAAIPNFRDYLQTLMGFAVSGKSPDVFSDWMSTLEKAVSKGSPTRFVQYLNFSENLFRFNALYKSEVILWSFDPCDYRFAYDSIPKLIIPTTNITGKTRADSTIIKATSGILHPAEQKFFGRKGIIYWNRAGLTEQEAKAELSNYQISVKTTRFSADSSTFYFPRYFKEPLHGVVSEKLTDNPQERDASYPRFTTYDQEFLIASIFKDVDYLGGISIQGAKLLGSGSPDKPARFTFSRDSKPFVEAFAQNFLIEEKNMQSSNARVIIRLDTDSIVHPGLVFRFLDDKRELFLLRNNEGSAKTPYFNSYHQLDMDFEVLVWKVDEPTIRFKAIAGAVESKALFESSDYFREERYIEIKGIDEESPLQMLLRLFDKTKRETFSASEVASFYKIDISQTRQIMRRLAYRGFILFDEETETITMKPRVRKYQLALQGKADYDVIQFFSNVGGTDNNAELSLLNWDLRMYGVSRIFLSDSQNVVIYPKNQELLVKKNRNFDFAGRVMAGRFEFFGKKFDFHYDRFKLNLDNVDSLRLRVEGNELDEYGKKNLIKVKTVIENVIGDILIDHPNNKSGRKSLAQYPIFNSVKNSYAYYQRTSILNNVYKRDNFYFQIDPYVVDSLDNFTNEGLIFKGTFVSAGILPELREDLKLQDDYSLGFRKNTGEGGMPVYGGKGTFINNLQLSHKGLRGDGEIDYITTKAKSDDFVFYPDSVNAFCRNLTVKAAQQGNVEFPDVEAADVRLHWEPYQPNKFEVAQTKGAIMMYAGESKLKGKIAIGESGMTGSGTLEFASAEVASKKFRFKKEDFKSDTASFAFTARDEVKDDGSKEVAIKTDNVKADVSFKNRMGQFKSNSSDSYIEFPVNKYIAYMDELRWYMDKEEVDMNSSMNEIDLIGSRFVSVKSDQDSLTFVAPRAKYALADRTIRTDGVKLIRVADATIYPDQEKINVERNAVISKLTNSRINANNDLKYHDIYNSSIDILSRKKFKATGDYDYEDELGKLQKISFSSIQQDTSGNTVASGEISEAQNFKLSQEFEFKGQASLFAPRKTLKFDGGVKIVHPCKGLERSWLKFKAEIDPENISIPVDSFPKTPDNEKILAGLVLVKDSTHVYPSFLTKKRKSADQEIISSRGFLRFDKVSQEFRITSKARYDDPSLADDYVAMKQENCDLNAEGKLNLGLDLGQVKLFTAGRASHSIVTDQTEFTLAVAIDYFLAPELIKQIEETISGTQGLQPADVTGSDYKKAMTVLLGPEAADRIFKDLASTGTIKRFPEELNKTFVFVNVNMKWNTETRSYVSEGWLSLSNIGKTPVNKTIKGKLELVKKRGGDILNLYLELESQKWYFFNFNRNIMYVLGGDENFNKTIREMDQKQRELKVEGNQSPYQFMIGVEKRKRDFVDR
jgi:hypothetical protein